MMRSLRTGVQSAKQTIRPRPKGNVLHVLLWILCLAAIGCLAVSVARRSATRTRPTGDALVVEMAESEDYGDATVALDGGAERPASEDAWLRTQVRSQLNGRQVIDIRIAPGIRQRDVFRVWQVIRDEVPDEVAVELTAGEE